MSRILVSRFVRRVLLADALVSAAAAAVMVLGGDALQALLGLPAALLLPAGLSLFVYAAGVAWLARRSSVPRAALWAALLCNVAWAVDCAAVALGPWFAPSGMGQAFLAVQVIAVSAFAELQFICLRRSLQPAVA